MTASPIYATPKGTRYHADAFCTGLNGSAMAYDEEAPAVTRGAAARRGLRPCATCNPAPLLTVVAGGRR